ncbi:hypothetical protein [Butyrivibrio sp. AE2032]|uniref:hypothetical protein n=1 Tax=Butyrivibrio sp. AE2032 TaxID=1458463 RepID=UPI00054ED220|nr:hypothetical protein [Butyrivibrio sp. AE2032]
MFKRVISYILITVMSLVLFAGCSPAEKDENKAFSAPDFVDECRILMPASKYGNMSRDEFAMKFTVTVFEQFGKSDYYKNMTDKERIDALNGLGGVLKTYSYGGVDGGFIDKFSVDSSAHEVTWHIKGDSEIESLWTMPGY